MTTGDRGSGSTPTIGTTGKRPDPELPGVDLATAHTDGEILFLHPETGAVVLRAAADAVVQVGKHGVSLDDE